MPLESLNRRGIVTLIGAATAASAYTFAARAQSPMPTIGFLDPRSSPESFADQMNGFRLGLKDAGYVAGENVAIEYRWADNRFERLSALAAELVHGPVTVIVASGGSHPALVAKAATSTVPIVFVVAEDPVGLGLVASLA